DIEKVAVCSSLRSLKSKCTIKYRAKGSSKRISLGHYPVMLASSHTVKSKTDIKSPTHYPCGTRHHKTPYELVHNKKPDLTFFRVFGALCYPTNDSEDLGKLQPTADTGIFVGYAPSRKEPSRAERPDPPAQVVQVSVSSTGTPLSTTIDQDAPSSHISPSSSALQSHSLPPGVNFKFTIIEDCWFQAMQDEIHEFDRLQVWELVPQPDCAMIIALKSSNTCLSSQESPVRAKASTSGL
nr:retrovirus-related Pol polyprotein from transposon TNT 1-94 [Tanacetum cinerariifolium]